MKNQEKDTKKIKICNICSEKKAINAFYKDKTSKDGYSGKCILCRISYNKDNKEYITKQTLKRNKLYHSIPENKEKIKIYNNLPKVKRRRSERRKERMNNEPIFKLIVILRSRFCKLLKKKNIYKTNSIIKYLGCTLEEYKQHLENQFLPEMNWGNHGEIWEIDHIKPCSSFNLIEEEEKFKCFNYLNLQPLFKTTEISEGLGYKNHIGNRNKSNNLNNNENNRKQNTR